MASGRDLFICELCAVRRLELLIPTGASKLYKANMIGEVIST